VPKGPCLKGLDIGNGIKYKGRGGGGMRVEVNLNAWGR